MDRRSFMGLMIGGVAAGAAVRTWPFRVYSFPAEPILNYAEFHEPLMIRLAWNGIQRSDYPKILTVEMSRKHLEALQAMCLRP